MAYVITDSCIKDALCVDVCPVDCIHPKKDEPQFEAATQMYVNPAECIDCGACVPVCTSDSLHPADDLPRQEGVYREERGLLQLASASALQSEPGRSPRRGPAHDRRPLLLP